MSFDYIREYYRVPAEAGRRVRYDGKEGVITRARNQYVMIYFDGDKNERGPFHPTDGVTYLGMGKVPKRSRSQERYRRYREADGAFDSFHHFLLYGKLERRARRLGFNSVSELQRWEATI